MMRADLHMHTFFSDGKFSPEEIARRVKQAGVALFSVTDHDNMEGTERAEAAARSEGLLFVRGMEISAYSECGKVHVLGYRLEKNAAYARFKKERKEGSYIRAEDSVGKGNAYFGTRISMKDVEEFHVEKDTPLHTMHVIDAFSKVLSKTRAELYRTVFPAGSPLTRVFAAPRPKKQSKRFTIWAGSHVLRTPRRSAGTEPRRKSLRTDSSARGSTA